MIPPMGYVKDKNTNEVLIVEEAAEIVRTIFKLYLDSYGLKAIARILNELGMKSPSYYQLKLIGKKQGNNKPEITSRFLWEYPVFDDLWENVEADVKKWPAGKSTAKKRLKTLKDKIVQTEQQIQKILMERIEDK